MPAADKNYVPALTGLRGIAAWWVVFYHFSEPLVKAPSWIKEFVSFGYLAVDLFFILSGYVIYLTTHSKLAHISWVSTWRFWAARVIRIYPLHLFVMMLFLLNPLSLYVFSASGVVGERYTWDYFFASLFLVQNWGFFPELKWNVPAWSISTEFATYLICPLLMWFGISKLERSRLALVLGILGAAFVLGIIFSLNEMSSIGDGITSLGLIRCILEFWMGLCIGALASHNCKSVLVKNPRLNSILIIILLGSAFYLSASTLKNYWFVPIIFSLLVYLIGIQQDIFSRILALRFIHYLGVISYSTYLIHFFVKDWVKFLSLSIGLSQFFIYLLACFIGSIISFHFFEKPSRIWLINHFFR